MTGRLVLLSGLPGVGKSALGRAFSAETGAVHLSVGVVEAAIQASNLAPDSVHELGLRIRGWLSADLIVQGHLVIADIGDAGPTGRSNWSPDAATLIVEVTNSDPARHRSRIEARHAENPEKPTWSEVQARRWVPWDRPVLTLDAAHLSIDDMVAAIQTALS